MPDMRHDETGVVEHVPARSRSVFERRGWSVLRDEAPAAYHNKPVWIDYAKSLGIDTDGMTKREIIAACGED